MGHVAAIFFSANFCPMLVAFLESKIVSNRSVVAKPPTTHQRKAYGTNDPLEVFANTWICFIKRLCLNFGLYPVLIACLGSEIHVGRH